MGLRDCLSDEHISGMIVMFAILAIVSLLGGGGMYAWHMGAAHEYRMAVLRAANPKIVDNRGPFRCGGITMWQAPDGVVHVQYSGHIAVALECKP